MDTTLTTKPELAVYQALTQLGFSFEFQSKMLGGRSVKGGVIADFYIGELNLIISVIGEYWHLNRPDMEMKDKLQRIVLENMGIKVIRILATDVMRNARYYVEQALMGIDHSGLS